MIHKNPQAILSIIISALAALIFASRVEAIIYSSEGGGTSSGGSTQNGVSSQSDGQLSGSGLQQKILFRSPDDYSPKAGGFDRQGTADQLTNTACVEMKGVKHLSLSGPSSGKGSEGDPLSGSDYNLDEKARASVDGNVAVFSDTMKGTIERCLARASKYLPHMKKELDDKGVPQELVYLPILESQFNMRARSGDTGGPWQLVSATARKYDLKIDQWVDERFDPIKSTRAVALYFQSLYEKFGSWDLVLASYNAGEGNIESAMRKSNANTFWDLSRSGHVRSSISDFVSRFLAAREIALDPGKHGIEEIGDSRAMKFDQVDVKPPATLSFIAKAAGTTEEQIRELNPELKKWCIPPDVNTYRLRIPEGTREAFLTAYGNAALRERAGDRGMAASLKNDEEGGKSSGSARRKQPAGKGEAMAKKIPQEKHQSSKHSLSKTASSKKQSSSAKSQRGHSSSKER